MQLATGGPARTTAVGYVAAKLVAMICPPGFRPPAPPLAFYLLVIPPVELWCDANGVHVAELFAVLRRWAPATAAV